MLTGPRPLRPKADGENAFLSGFNTSTLAH